MIWNLGLNITLGGLGVSFVNAYVITSFSSKKKA